MANCLNILQSKQQSGVHFKGSLATFTPHSSYTLSCTRNVSVHDKILLLLEGWSIVDVILRAGLKDRQTRQLPRAPKPEGPQDFDSKAKFYSRWVTELWRPSMQLNICSYYLLLLVMTTASYLLLNKHSFIAKY